MKFFVKIYLIIFGKKVGSDHYGNTYFLVRFKKKDLNKRFVIYKGINEASKVPPEWEAWLRYSTNEPINSSFKPKKLYLPNLTGTIYSYKYTRNINTKKFKSFSSWQG